MESNRLADDIYLKMIEKTTGGGNQEVDTLGKLVGLSLTVGTSNDNSESLVVVLEQILGNSKDLKSQLTGRRDNNNTGT